MRFTEAQFKEQFEKFKQSTLTEEEMHKAKQLSTHLKDKMKDLLTIIDMVKATLQGKYQLDSKTLGIFIFVIVYVISPLDLVPDAIPMLGWLDDIAFLGFAMKQYAPIVNKYLAVHQSIAMTVDTVAHNMIEERVTEELKKINKNLDQRYASLGKEFAIELAFFIFIIMLKYFYPMIPAKWIIVGFIIFRTLFAFLRNTFAFHCLLKQIEFYRVSRFFSYLKMTKNLHEAFKLDLKNFYQYHYERLLNPAVKIAHQITTHIQLTPSNEDIFERIYLSLKKNIPLIMKKKLILFLILFSLYSLVVFTLRQLAQAT